MISFQHFATLPYPVQEYIITLVDDVQTFLALSVASKYLSILSYGSLYERLDFTVENMGKKLWPHQQYSIQISNVRYQQRILVSTLLQHPQLGLFTRSLSWEVSDDYSWQYGLRLPTENVWSAFKTLDALHTLDLKVNVGNETSAPEVPLFPNLQIARIEGHFPKGSLEKILHTSPYLQELRIVGNDTAEHRGYLRSIGLDITPFLVSSVDKRAFPRLQVLELCIARRPNLDALGQFLIAHSQTLAEVTVELAEGVEIPNEWFENCLLPHFKTHEWPNLKSLSLVNVPLPSISKDELFRYCDTLSQYSIRWNDGGNMFSQLYTREE